MAAEQLSSTSILNTEAKPRQAATAGEGAPGEGVKASDFVNTTAAGAVIGSQYRLCRIPTRAKIKRVYVGSKGVDTNAAATWAADVNIAFSDDANDGTQVALQAAIPQNTFNGAVTTPAAYVNPNKLFGSVSAANAGALKETDVTFSGSFAPDDREEPLWNVCGFTDSLSGNPRDPGGNFDIFLNVTANAATAGAGVVFAEIEAVF